MLARLTLRPLGAPTRTPSGRPSTIPSATRAAGGGAVQTMPLEAPFAPFLMSWSPCGTRLAMLSGWHHRQCALSYSG